MSDRVVSWCTVAARSNTTSPGNTPHHTTHHTTEVSVLLILLGHGPSPTSLSAVRPSVHEMHQRLNARPQQLPATLIPSVATPAPQQKADPTKSSSSSSSSSTGPAPFSARRPTFSAARSRAPLPVPQILPHRGYRVTHSILRLAHAVCGRVRLSCCVGVTGPVHVS